MDVAQVIEGVRSGDRRSIARAISFVENGSPELPVLSAGLFPHTGGAWTVGLTGSPGVGKSSLAGALVRAAREADERVAVLAIDPTSPFSGGALLGDRVRMQAHATDEGVFIRSMATRGHLGGMALAAPEAVRILDASGADLIVVETVGVGQAELEVAHATDTTVVVVTPGWGDAVQVSKAGILEIADVFVVNKADQAGTNEAARELESMIRMGERRPWRPPVIRTSVSEGTGIDELRNALNEHRLHLESAGALEAARALRIRREVEGLCAALLKRRAEARLDADPSLLEDLLGRRTDPYRAAELLVGELAGAPSITVEREAWRPEGPHGVP